MKDRGAWRAAVHGIARNWPWVSDWTTRSFFTKNKQKTACSYFSLSSWASPNLRTSSFWFPLLLPLFSIRLLMFVLCRALSHFMYLARVILLILRLAVLMTAKLAPLGSGAREKFTKTVMMWGGLLSTWLKYSVGLLDMLHVYQTQIRKWYREV